MSTPLVGWAVYVAERLDTVERKSSRHSDRAGGQRLTTGDEGLEHVVQRRQYGGAAMFGFLGWIVFGLVVGAVAKLLMPGKDPGGIIVTMLLGIVGALLGGFVGRSMGMYDQNQSAGVFMSFIAAVFVALIYPSTVGRARTV